MSLFKCLDERRKDAVNRLLLGMGKEGGSAMRRTFEGLVGTAFDGGAVAMMAKVLDFLDERGETSLSSEIRSWK